MDMGKNQDGRVLPELYSAVGAGSSGPPSHVPGAGGERCTS